MRRDYPALDLTWSLAPGRDRIERLMAEIDDEAPTAVEELDAGLRVFFSSSVARGRAAVRLIAFDPTITCRPVDVSDEDWAARSQAALGPVRIGRLVVAPPSADDDRRAGPADRADDSSSPIVIIIRPSMGFGTGHHASTRLCLRLLQQVPVADARGLDIGTGSGVLAIAAAKLGATHVVAIDVEEDALVSARENIETNAVSIVVEARRFDAMRSDSGSLGPGFDVVLANLTGAQLIELAGRLARFVRARGALIVSGVTTGESTSVIDALSLEGFELDRRLDEDDWVGLALRRRDG